MNFWRSVGGSQNCFFYESFIDELAHAAGKDPYEFRRAMVDRVDFVGVLEKLNEKSNWKQKLPKGQGRGIAVAENHGAVVGTVAEVTVRNGDQIHVDRLVVAVDCYHVVNPKIIEAQMQSGAIFGLSPCSMARCRSSGPGAGAELRHLSRVRPKPPRSRSISCRRAARSGAASANAVTATIAPAIANAIFAASGKRVRELPLKNVKLSQLASI